MADTYNKKEREKKKARKKKEKQERREERRSQEKQGDVIMYVDFNGNFTPNKPEGLPEDAPLAEVTEPVTDKEYSGTIKFVNEEKGFGFIENVGRSGDVFFPLSSVKEIPKKGQTVYFNQERSERGMIAVDIELG